MRESDHDTIMPTLEFLFHMCLAGLGYCPYIIET